MLFGPAARWPRRRVDLQAAINRYIAEHNVDPKPFTWTKPADQILAKVKRLGDPELIAVWRDPDFDPGRRAFYYARVIEIPTPRWTAYDAKRFGTEMPADARMTTQERAYTHPSGTRRTPEVVTPRQRITQARRSCDGNVRRIFQVELRARRSRIC